MANLRCPSLLYKRCLRAGLSSMIFVASQVALVDAFQPFIGRRIEEKSLCDIESFGVSQSTSDSSALQSSLSDDGDFALIGLNAEAPLNPFEVTNAKASAFGLQSADEILASTLESDDETPENSRSNIVDQPATVTGRGSGMEVEDSKAEGKPTTRSSNDKRISDELSGLTADGDFILEGVNAIDPTANQGLEKYGSPLIDPNGGVPAEGDLLSQLSLTQTPSAQQSTTTNVEIDNLSGLTDDGDIALVGFNTAQPSLSSSEQRQVDQTDILSSLMQKQQQQLMDPMTATQQQQARPQVSAEEVEDMTMWLQDIISTLSDDDCIYYAEQLLGLGFHQDCVTKCELRLTDLAFMRPLHGRYFFHEVKGIPHPPDTLENYDYDQERVVFDDDV